MRFEWEDAKAAANLRKHGVGFGEAAEVFGDPNIVTDVDVRHSHDEVRFFAVGIRPGVCCSSSSHNSGAK